MILAGGAGRRLGGEKAFFTFYGRSFLEIVADTLGEVVDELVVVARDGEQARRLLALVPDARLELDVVAGAGPLAGLASGLDSVKSTYSFACGCDLPFLCPEAVQALFDLAEGYEGAVPVRDGAAERLHAVYASQPMARACHRALEMGARRVAAPLEDMIIRYVPALELARYDPGLLTLFNVNTREDLREAEEIWRENRMDASLSSRAGQDEGGIRVSPTRD